MKYHYKQTHTQKPVSVLHFYHSAQQRHNVYVGTATFIKIWEHMTVFPP